MVLTLDWAGQTALVAASGPSQRQEDIEAARGKARVVVINNTWRLAPWADVLYACDQSWWEQEAPGPEFAGLRIIGKGEFPGCVSANVAARERMIFEGDSIGGGANSGFQAVNLVVRWGCRRVILTGFDYQNAGNHWHGRHQGNLRHASERTVSIWIDCMNRAAPELAERGVEVLNATRETALTCFPRVRLEDVI